MTGTAFGEMPLEVFDPHPETPQRGGIEGYLRHKWLNPWDLVPCLQVASDSRNWRSGGLDHE
jgi:hypothetical protein